MMNFSVTPNFLNETISHIIISENAPREVLDFFEKRNITVIFSRRNPDLPFPVCYHTDMNIIHLGGNEFLLDGSQLELKRNLEALGGKVYFSGEKVSGAYPFDVRLNIYLDDKIAVGNFKHTDKVLFEKLRGKKLYNVPQGYAKCSILPLSESAFITDDESIRKALSKDMDVLLIEKGDISLFGMSYGFIGGSSVKISENEVFFFGDIRRHKSYFEIKSFFEKYGFEVLYCEIPLIDLGGGIVF